MVRYGVAEEPREGMRGSLFPNTSLAPSSFPYPYGRQYPAEVKKINNG